MKLIKSKERKSDRQQQLKNSKLLPCHLKALLKCRENLKQALKPDMFKSIQMKERTSSFSKLPSSGTPNLSLPPNFDFQQKDLDNDCERISLFLDQLEVSDERTFANFMDSLKEHNKNIHKTLEKTIKLFELEDEKIDEYDNGFRELGETSSLSGQAVLQIIKQHKLRNSIHSIDDNSMLQNVNDCNFQLLNNVLDDKNHHLNCFVVNSRPKHYDKCWIKHDSRRKVVHSNDNAKKTYMAEVTKDIVFKTIQFPLLPSYVKKPPENIEKIYVLDEQSIYSPVASERDASFQRKYETKNKYGSKKCINSRIKNADFSKCFPPPLPPKPDVLTPIPIVKTKEKNKCNSTKLGNVSSDVSNSNNSDAPPIPVRQKLDSFSKPPPALPASYNSRESMKSARSSNVCSSETMSPQQSVSHDPADDDDNEDYDYDDENDLNYNVELEDTGEAEEAYEPITPMIPAAKQIVKYDLKNEFAKETFVNVDEGGNVINSTNPDDDMVETTASNEQCQLLNVDANSNSPPESNKTFQNNVAVENDYIDVVDNKNLISSHQDSTATNENQLAEDSVANLDTKILSEKVSHAIDTGKVEQTNEKCSDGSIETLTTTTVSVSRSSSGVSATVSDQTTARDSGVDSTISHSLHDSPFCVSDLVDDLDTVIPNSLICSGTEKLEILGKSNETSYYEDIDSMNPRESTYSSHYLDPRSEVQTFNEKAKNTCDQKVLPVGTLLLCDSELALPITNNAEIFKIGEASNNPDQFQYFKQFMNTYLAYDKEGYAYYIPYDFIKTHGDPRNEPWFYPKPLSVKEATIFLNQESQKGCFVVYTPHNDHMCQSVDNPIYYLSVCENNEGDVYHYPIFENVRGDIMFEDSDRSFLSIYELVSFYKKDRENLITRLRRPLKESKLPITPGYHYPQHLEVSKKSIRLFGEIISRSKFCVTCKGNYGHQMVLVKALQHYLVIENEDDFLEEARTMMKLDHQNIAKLLGVCFRTRPYYIILENFNCGTLKNALSNGIIQSGWPEMLIDISLQILSAMVYLEKLHYLLHRNLKSSNFLISSEYSIKLFDFERARLVDDDCYRASPQDEVSIRWSAPEVFLHSLYSTKSDVWSAGVVLWELFSFGQVPYSQLTDSEVVVFISEKGKLEKPAECDIQMFSIMNQCWKYKPDMRPTFQSLEEKMKMQYAQFSDSYIRLRSTSDNNPSTFAVKSDTFRSDIANNNNNNTISNTNNNIALPIKPSKRHSHSGPATPMALTPALQLKNNTLQCCENDAKIDDIMKSLGSNNKHNSKSPHLFNSRQNKNFETNSANVPFSQVINSGESRDNKIRKSLRNFLKKGNLNIKNSE